ncbi:ArnT family glycosyltransferase [Priestia megaterium]|nr:glycosyltransferase family 39 protein [Bacillus zanthoxyli]
MNINKKVLISILILGFVLRILTFFVYGYDINLSSDDENYRISAKTLLDTGMLTYVEADIPTVHIMPGQVWLLTIPMLIFGKGTMSLIATKLMFIMIGILSIFLIYKLGSRLFNEKAGLIAAFLLAVYFPQILMDNLTLTESPFIAVFLALIYYSIKLADDKKMSTFLMMLLLYFIALFLRVQIAFYPIFLFIYLLLMKYPFKLMMKQFSISVIALLFLLGPWWYRNYIDYHKFIPLTGGSGNPLLLGSYFGENVPPGDYGETVKRIDEENPGANKYEIMEAQKVVAEERIKEWWKKDKVAFIKSYLYLKPQKMWRSEYYPIEIFLSNPTVNEIGNILKKVSVIATFTTFFLFRKRRKEIFFLVSLLFFQTYFNSSFFAFDRYALPMMPILFILLAGTLSFLVNHFLSLRQPKESR